MSNDTDFSAASETFEFKAEVQQLLNILVHSLYTEREIFLRELLSNASDALHRIQFEMLTEHDVEDPDAELAIRVMVDEEAGTITVSDTGIGMTREEIVQNLGIIAHSGATAFLQRLQAADRPAVELIGQFGVGFYSVFMVADSVRVISRSYLPGTEAVEWVSDGTDHYQLVPADKTSRGTDVVIHLKEDAVEFVAAWRLEQIVTRHSDFVSFPIYFGDKQEPTNRRMALWRQPPQEVSQEQYDEFYKHLTLDFEPPLLHTHLVTDAPVDVRAVLYVPSRRERGMLSPRTEAGLKLYINNVMIQEYNRDLLPNHFRFVEGIVESEDLPLNISRETVQRSPAARRVQRVLTRKVVKELIKMADERPEDYDTFWLEFGPFIKEGVAAAPSAGTMSDPRDKDDLLPLLAFHSSKSEGALVSLAEYVERMGSEQEAIYYVLGDDLKSVAHSPHLDYFQAHDIEVLYLVEPIDPFVMMAVQDYDGKPLKNVDVAELVLPEEDEEEEAVGESIPEADFNRLVGRFVQVLDDRVLEVRASKMLRDSPCRLVSPGGDPASEMSRVYRMLDREFEAPKQILEINRSHPIISNLAYLVSNAPDSAIIDPAIEQLFANQLLMEGLHPNPAEMIPRIQQLMVEATAAEGA